MCDNHASIKVLAKIGMFFEYHLLDENQTKWAIYELYRGEFLNP